MDEQGKIYWHEAHFEAMQLELYAYRDVLTFVQEYELSQEALRMDALIIKKNKDIPIEKNIGKIFRTHNIVEYKSEKDNFSFWDYQKVLGYAHIYSAFEKVPMLDITISISLTIYPRDLVKTLISEYGLTIEDTSSGIYYIHGGSVPIQILESKKLPIEENLFIRNLRSNLSQEDMLRTLQAYKKYKSLNDKNVFIDRLVNANPYTLKEVMDMSDETLQIITEALEKRGWLQERDQRRTTEDAKKIATKMMLRGHSPEEVADITELSIETVRNLYLPSAG